MNDPVNKVIKNAIDGVYPFRMGKEQYIEFTGSDAKKYFVKLEVQSELTIDTPVGKRDVAVLHLMVKSLEQTSLPYVSLTWVDKELLIPWGRKVIGMTFPSKSVEGSFLIMEIKEN